MIQENEIITLVLFIALMLFMAFNRKKLKDFPGIKIFMASSILLFLSVICTVAEGFLLEDELNILEHLFRSVSALLLVFWSMSFRSEGREA
ncbi:MAG: hypothetical protein JXN63_09475 [Candidatus Delongbacteria bacterium]|nr:hypothetical protein [Candidatus Delongbacteria bacterium]